MDSQTKTILIGTAAGIFMFLLLGGIILSFLFKYRSRQREHAVQLDVNRSRFEKELLSAQLETQARVFDEISLELHDNVGHDLSLSVNNLNLFLYKTSNENGEIQEARSNLITAMSKISNIARSLNNHRIMDVGLPKLIEEEKEKLNRSGVLQAEVEIGAGYNAQLNGESQIIVFRILQECIQNVLKHSGADLLRISLLTDQGVIILKVSDNGRGFSHTGNLEKLPGIGLRNIMQRSKLLGGTATIDSSGTTGTTITLNIPCD